MHYCGLKECRFWLSNAPGTLHRDINTLLSEVKWKYALEYLDDIIIFTESVEDHLKHVSTAVRPLNTSLVTLYLQKFSMFTYYVCNFGHVIPRRVLEVSERTTDVIEGVKEPSAISVPNYSLG